MNVYSNCGYTYISLENSMSEKHSCVEPSVVAHRCHPNPWKQRQKDRWEFKAIQYDTLSQKEKQRGRERERGRRRRKKEGRKKTPKTKPKHTKTTL